MLRSDGSDGVGRLGRSSNPVNDQPNALCTSGTVLPNVLLAEWIAEFVNRNHRRIECMRHIQYRPEALTSAGIFSRRGDLAPAQIDVTRIAGMSFHLEEQSTSAPWHMEVISLIVLLGRKGQIPSSEGRYPVIIGKVFHRAFEVMVGGKLASESDEDTLLVA